MNINDTWTLPGWIGDVDFPKYFWSWKYDFNEHRRYSFTCNLLEWRYVEHTPPVYRPYLGESLNLDAPEEGWNGNHLQEEVELMKKDLNRPIMRINDHVVIVHLPQAFNVNHEYGFHFHTMKGRETHKMKFIHKETTPSTECNQVPTPRVPGFHLLKGYLIGHRMGVRPRIWGSISDPTGEQLPIIEELFNQTYQTIGEHETVHRDRARPLGVYCLEDDEFTPVDDYEDTEPFKVLDKLSKFARNIGDLYKCPFKSGTLSKAGLEAFREFLDFPDIDMIADCKRERKKMIDYVKDIKVPGKEDFVFSSDIDE